MMKMADRGWYYFSKYLSKLSLIKGQKVTYIYYLSKDLYRRKFCGGYNILVSLVYAEIDNFWPTKLLMRQTR